MNKIILLVVTMFLSCGAFAADCSKAKTSHNAQICLNSEVKALKLELSSVFNSALEQTEAKSELKTSQAKWLAYKESQCGDFVVADAQGSSATAEYDLYCQAILYKQRINLIKKIFN